MVRFRDFIGCVPFCDQICVFREYAGKDADIYSGSAEQLKEKLDRKTADYLDSDWTYVMSVETSIRNGYLSLEIYVFNAEDR